MATHSVGSCLENPMDKKSLAGHSPQGHKESDTTERLHFLFPPAGSKALFSQAHGSSGLQGETDGTDRLPVVSEEALRHHPKDTDTGQGHQGQARCFMTSPVPTGQLQAGVLSVLPRSPLPRPHGQVSAAALPRARSGSPEPHICRNTTHQRHPGNTAWEYLCFYPQLNDD